MEWKTDADGVVVYDDSLYWKLALPAVAVSIELTIVGLFLALAVLTGGPAAPGRMLLWVALGFVAWTGFEYVVHRWLFHQTGHPVLRWIYKHAHMPHHRVRRMEDDNHRTLHPSIAIPALVPHFLLGLWLGADGYVAGTAGFVVGYCAYEWLHYLFPRHRLPASLEGGRVGAPPVPRPPRAPLRQRAAELRLHAAALGRPLRHPRPQRHERGAGESRGAREGEGLTSTPYALQGRWAGLPVHSLRPVLKTDA